MKIHCPIPWSCSPCFFVYATGRPTATTKRWLRDFLHWLSTFPFAHEARTLLEREKKSFIYYYSYRKKTCFHLPPMSQVQQLPIFSPCLRCSLLRRPAVHGLSGSLGRHPIRLHDAVQGGRKFKEQMNIPT